MKGVQCALSRRHQL